MSLNYRNTVVDRAYHDEWSVLLGRSTDRIKYSDDVVGRFVWVSGREGEHTGTDEQCQ